MTADIIHDEMLSDIPAMRLALGRHYKWCYHVTPLRNVSSIRARGLEPRADMAPPAVVVEYLGETAKNIICLNPLGTDIVVMSEVGQSEVLTSDRSDLALALALPNHSGYCPLHWTTIVPLGWRSRTS